LDEFRVLGADDLTRFKTWVDVAYAVHVDMRSHTGGAVSFGTGAALSKSSKQKLNTKSSTEGELVGGSDYLPHSIWTKKFMEAQGYAIKENTFYQDNQSAIRFMKNGRKSCGQKSKHIDIRYFFIKDRLEIEDYTVEYCPTEQMLADFFTKALQGNLFRRLSAVIMGHKHIDSLKEFMSAKSQKQVAVSFASSVPPSSTCTLRAHKLNKGPITSATSQERVGDDGSARDTIVTKKNGTCADTSWPDENESATPTTSGPTRANQTKRKPTYAEVVRKQEHFRS
jgi:KUP system potassium uptake protein